MPRCRIWVLGLISLLPIAGSCLAQRPAPNFNTRTDVQSVLLYRIRYEDDRAKKLLNMEEFVATYPKDEAIGWVLEQMLAIYLDNKQLDQTMDIAFKLLALDPADVELAYHNLKLAEEKKDPAVIRKWTQLAALAARQAMASPDQSETGARRHALAPQVIAYIDYLSYAEILQTTDRQRKLDMMEQFLRRSPQSPYAPALTRMNLAAWREADPQKAVALAETMLEKDQSNEEALIMVAEYYMQKEKDPDKVIEYAERVIAIMEQGSKPEGTTDADWAKKKVAFTARANWMIGSIAMQRNKFSQADKSIRAALPYLRNDGRQVATALFYLGWANYQIGNIPDAIRFNQECARFKGPFQEQAAKNLSVIRSETAASASK